jgi:hypothetical protein
VGSATEQRWVPQRLADVSLDGAAPWAFAALAIVAAGVIVSQTQGTTFSADEWQWIMYRRGNSLAAFLHPYNGHLSLIPIAIYRVLFATAGLRTYVPYRALVIAAHLIVSTLVFVYVRRRMGGYFGLLAGAVILFFGPGWNDILWPFQLAWMISVGAGVGALLALERRDRLGDAAGCALLACSLASSGVGIAVALGVAIDVLAAPDRRRRAWIVVVPVVLFAIWWIAYQNAGTQASAIFDVPDVVGAFLSGTFSGLAGLTGDTVPLSAGTMLDFGPPLALAAAVVLVWRLRAATVRATLTRTVALLAIVLFFAVLVGLGREHISHGYESRYLYVGAVFSLLLFSQLLAGVRAGDRARAVCGVLAAAVVVSNLGVLREGGAYERSQAVQTRADLAALDIARPHLPPDYVAGQFPGWPLILLRAGAYFSAARALGTPAASPAQVLTDPPSVRRLVDSELIRADGVTMATAGGGAGSASGGAAGAAPRVVAATGGRATTVGGCVRFVAASFTPVLGAHLLVVGLGAGGVTIHAAGGQASVSIRRFGATFQPLGTVQGSAALRAPADLSSVPWQLQVATDGGVEVCGRG